MSSAANQQHLEELLIRLARGHANYNRGVGGYATSVHDLRPFAELQIPGCTSAEIIAVLKQLHIEGRVYMQYWETCLNPSESGFRPWNDTLKGTFFNDFRLLPEAPRF